MTAEAPVEPLLSCGATLARQAAKTPSAIAVSCEGNSRTWGELHKRTNRIARALAARGVKLGDFLTIALPNSVGFIEACYGAWKLGAIPQPVSSRLPAAEIKAIVELANPPVVVSELTADAGKPIVSIARLLSEATDESDLPDLVSPSWKAPTSGGSTGRPKLIVSGSPALVEAAGALFWRVAADDICVMPGPLYHNGPFITAFLALQVGARLVLMTKFDAEGTLREIAQNKATWVYLVPTMMSRIWRLPPEVRAKYDVSSLKTVWHLAAPCPPWLKEEWINWLGGEVIMELYGGTEGVATTALTGTEWMAHRGSVGRVVMGGEMKAFSPDGKPLGPDETGEIYMKRSPDLPPSYRYLGAEARSLPGGWESIGDIGWFDAEGYLYLADRRTDMILVGGANVYPAEVEAALDEHPLVQSSCVIGLPDDDIGNRIHAIVQPRGSLTAEDLQSHLAERLVIYKRPRSFEFVTEPLRDDAGKVRRSQLRQERMATATAASQRR